TITFNPSTLGERDGYIIVADDSADSPQRIQVLGVATMALAHLGPDRLTFSQNVGASSAPQTVTLANRGDGPLSIAAIAATGDFKASPHCPALLLPGLSCPISVTFTPTAAGARSGSLVVTDDGNAAPGSNDTVRLTGVAYQPLATLSATILSPGANLGGSAAPQVVTVTNTGNGALTIRAIGIGGAAAGDYSQSNNCLRTIAPGASCSISVNFTPHGYGVRAAALTLSDDGPGGTQSVSLRGTGTAARALVSSGFLNFGGSGMGSPTLPQNVVLFNAGNGLLSISSLKVSGDDFIMSTSCGSTLAAGASCTIRVTFLPHATGARAGTVTVIDNAGVQRITLSGVGTSENSHRDRVHAGSPAEENMLCLIIDDMQKAADVLKALYEQTKHKDGDVSIEGLPRVADDTQGTIAMAHDLYDRGGRPNIFFKIPATD